MKNPFSVFKTIIEESDSEWIFMKGETVLKATGPKEKIQSDNFRTGKKEEYKILSGLNLSCVVTNSRLLTLHCCDYRARYAIVSMASGNLTRIRTST